MSLLLSSLLSLIIGTIVGLTQSRIKRLLAFSTISHVGFVLLGLSIHTVQSTQAFFFYLMQYSLSSLNAFIIIITIGYSLYFYVYKENDKDKSSEQELNSHSKAGMSDNLYPEKDKQINNTIEKTVYIKQTDKTQDENKASLQDINNSPIQLIDQLKGYYYTNPLLALSLAITLFSFAGIPPLIGFFAKQVILSAAIENDYIFMSLVAILTSVISAVYYLAIIKQMFFDKPDYTVNSDLKDFNASGYIFVKSMDDSDSHRDVSIKINNIVLSSSLTVSISIITFIIMLFILIPEELYSLTNLLALLLFNI